MIELLGPITLALIPGFMLLDFVINRRTYKTTKQWRLRGSLVTVGIFYFTTSAAIFWGTLLEGISLFDGSGLGIIGGAVVGIIVYELAHYWYHRAAHKMNWLWLAGHQMHHSAESLDAFGAYYLHPLDAFMFTTLNSLVFFPILGLLPEAGAVSALFLTFNAMLQHANIKTPHWLGYIIQRPESHAIHHGRGIHKFNYSDLALWDILFGTFRNPSPEDDPKTTGFYLGGSSRILDMLLCQDVSKPEVVPVERFFELTKEEVYEQLSSRQAA